MINIKDLFQIAGSLHNLYGPKLGSNPEQNETFIERPRNLSVENALFIYLVQNKLFNRRSKYKKFDEKSVTDFPALSGTVINEITMGSYQTGQAMSYLSEHLKDNSFPFFKLDCTIDNIVNVKIQSRHINNKEYKIYVKYNKNMEGSASIISYMQSGTKDLGLLCPCNRSHIISGTHTTRTTKPYFFSTKISEKVN